MVTTENCDFDKSTGSLVLSSRFTEGRFPREVTIQSHHTGRKVTFTHITPDHPRYDEDGWDGEMALYVPSGDVPTNVRLLTMSHDQP